MLYPNKECEELDCVYNKRWRCLYAGIRGKWPASGSCTEYHPFWGMSNEVFEELEELKENVRMTTSTPLTLLKERP